MIADLINAGLLIGFGLAIGLADRRRFDVRWLAVAVGLFLVENMLLENFWGLIPRMIPGHWNWQGKILALAATLAIAALPAFGWRRAGITLRQRPGSLRASLPAVALYVAIIFGIILAFGGEAFDREEFAFQLTMPGLEEEPFFRGILLLALDRAYAGRVHLLGVDWGWGAALSCVAFGLVHALDYAHGAVAFDPLTFALTGGPALISVWLRYRTGSLVLPVLLHNFGNSVRQLV